MRTIRSATARRGRVLAGALVVAAGAALLPGLPAAALPTPVVYDWTTGTTGASGSWLPVVAMSGDGAALWELSGGAVRVSSDGGTTWAAPASPPPAMTSAIALAVSDDGSTIAITGSSIVISRNGGATWSTLPAPFLDPAVGISTAALDADGDTLIVGNGNFVSEVTVAVYRTSTSSWTLADTPASGFSPKTVDVNDAGTVFSAAGPGQTSSIPTLWVSRDAGGTWAVPTNVPAGSVDRAALNGAGTELRILQYRNGSIGGARTDLAGNWTVQSGSLPNTVTFGSADDADLAITGDTTGTAVLRDADWADLLTLPTSGIVVGAAMSNSGDTILLARYNAAPLVGQRRTLPTVTSAPVDASAAAGATATFSVIGAGTPTPTVRWQREVQGIWTDIPGAVSTIYSVTASSALSGARFRAVLTNSAGDIATTAAVLTVSSGSGGGAPSGGTPAPVPVEVEVALVLGFTTGDLVRDGLDAGISGMGLLPGSAWTVDLFSTPTRVASGTADGTGAFRGIVTVPAGTPAGSHRLLLTGTAPNGTAVTSQAWFAIDASGRVVGTSMTGPVAAAAARTTRGLAQTGAELPVAGLAGLAALLLAGAGAALVAARRRRTV